MSTCEDMPQQEIDARISEIFARDSEERFWLRVGWVIIGIVIVLPVTVAIGMAVVFTFEVL